LIEVKTQANGSDFGGCLPLSELHYGVKKKPSMGQPRKVSAGMLLKRLLSGSCEPSGPTVVRGRFRRCRLIEPASKRGEIT
jgi:hypothetical protein